MKWNQYRLETTTQAVEMVGAVLLEHGVDGFQVEDKIPLSKEDKEKMYIDILPELPEDDGKAYLTFYLEQDENCVKMLDAIQEGFEELRIFCDPGSGNIEQAVTDDNDWVNNWKKYFKPFEVDGIVIKPTWEEKTEQMQGKMVIEMDPGTAFGTGMHETTQLVIKQLRKYIQPDTRLLDVGCGSGILSIIAAKLGIAEGVGTDIDEAAIVAADENVITNQIPEGLLEYFKGNIIDDKATKERVGYEKYDVVVANILADVIIPLSKVIAPHMKTGGIFITSGIINNKEQDVVEAMKQNPELEIIDITYQNDWVSVTAKKVG